LNIREWVRRALGSHPSLRIVAEATNEDELLQLLTEAHSDSAVRGVEPPDLILASTAIRKKNGDLGLAPHDSLVHRLRHESPESALVVIAHQPDECTEALAEGATASFLDSELEDYLETSVLRVLRRNGRDETVLIDDELVDAHPQQTAVYIFGADVFFNARHFVVMDGKAGPVHPHSFRVHVKLRQESDTGKPIELGFAEVRDLVQTETKKFNDTILNHLEPFNQGTAYQPTVENIAAHLYHTIKHNLPFHLAMDSVTVWDSPTVCVTYMEKDA
jgi:6-pyruvoyl-tetrahydropterin synthase/DNA-binding NarL/FixJ family response regulator